MAQSKEGLFLLEFLVDNVGLEYSIQQSLKCMAGNTCVSFQFLDNDAICVCEEDFMPSKRNYTDGCGGCSTMKNGKSCLFALDTAQAERGLKQFDIYVEVFRRMKPGTLPEKMTIGESLISIANLFGQVVKEANESEDDKPCAKTLKDCFKIHNQSGELVGRIGIYIKLTMFGKLIVTHFQMNLQNRNVEFKGNDGHFMFKSKSSKSNRIKGRPCNPCPVEANVNCGQYAPQANFEQTVYADQMCDPCGATQEAQCQMTASDLEMFDQQACPPCCTAAAAPCNPCSPCNPCAPAAPCPCCGQCPPCPVCGQITPCRKNPCEVYQMTGSNCCETPCYECSGESPCPPIPPPPCDSDYQEFGAEMGGNSLVIRVHKNRKVDEGGAEQECFCEPADAARGKAAVNQCPPYLPPSAPQAARQPGGRGDCANVAQSGDPRSPFTFRVGGATQDTNTVSLIGPNLTSQKRCPKIGDITHPDKEVFVLRIAKKNENAASKNKMEIELCTPRGKEYKKPLNKEEREQQCDKAEIVVAAKSSKRSKSGKKGGKKGKGKKK